MCAQHGAVVKEGREVRLLWVLRARGHRPCGLTGVLRLDREQRADNLARRGGEGLNQALTAQPPARDVEVMNLRAHIAAFPGHTRTDLADLRRSLLTRSTPGERIRLANALTGITGPLPATASAKLLTIG